MFTLIDALLAGDFMPHGHCLLWRTDLLLLNIFGDALTALAYAIIPMALVYLVRRRRDLAFDWVFVMFATFIFACGTTHLLALVNIWHGYYYLEGLAKLVTGLVSITTAVMVWPLVPRVVALPGRAELVSKNLELERTQSALQQVNENLEQRVAERTAELERQAQELARSNAELERLAVTDHLTGLANRRRVLQLMSDELARCARYGSPFSVQLIDLDDFKQVNDTHGHAAGDAALILLAQVLREAVRETDVVGRLGGEEFLVLLPNTDAEHAKPLGERIRAEVALHSVPVPDGSPAPLRCSVGIAERRDDRATVETLLAAADEAMYEAKRAGKNRVVVG